MTQLVSKEALFIAAVKPSDLLFVCFLPVKFNEMERGVEYHGGETPSVTADPSRPAEAQQ